MKERLSISLDENVHAILKLQAQVLEMSLSTYINKLLRDALKIQDKNIDAAYERLKRFRELED